jgi:hypothetical protein
MKVLPLIRFYCFCFKLSAFVAKHQLLRKREESFDLSYRVDVFTSYLSKCARNAVSYVSPRYSFDNIRWSDKTMC